MPSNSASENKHDVWKIISLVLSGVLVTGITSWLTFGTRYMTREEIINFVRTQSPYAIEREFIRDKLSSLERISSQLDAVKNDVVKLNVKFDIFMDRLSTSNRLFNPEGKDD